MYSSSFCRVYDEFGWNYFPMYFGEMLLAWIEERRKEGKTIRKCLDLACGTGVLCGILHENGFDARGMDLTEGMIEAARKNHPGIPFEAADMVTYRPEGRFDLITCTGDAVNHITDKEDLERIFRNVMDWLEPGGYFIFDFLNRKETLPGEPFEVEYSEHVKLHLQITNEDELVHLHIRTYEDGVLKFEEDIREKYYEPEWICRTIAGCGFLIGSCGGTLERKAGGEGTAFPETFREDAGATWILTAEKPPEKKTGEADRKEVGGEI